MRRCVIPALTPRSTSSGASACSACIASAQADIAQADANIAAMRAEITNTQATVEAAKADVVRTQLERERQEALVQSASATRQKLEQVTADEQRFGAQFESRKADLAKTQALLLQALGELDGRGRLAAGTRAADPHHAQLVAFVEARHDFGGGFVDWRGWFKNAGA